MSQSAREIAISDIRDALKQESRSFIAFRTKLNPTINRIVNNYIKEQQKQP